MPAAYIFLSRLNGSRIEWREVGDENWPDIMKQSPHNKMLACIWEEHNLFAGTQSSAEDQIQAASSSWERPDKEEGVAV